MCGRYGASDGVHTCAVGTDPTGNDLQAQIDALVHQVTANRADIDALTQRADASDARADASDSRADDMEARAQLDRDMISELQSDGVLGQEHQTQMEEALKSSRTIGAAIGLIMASRHVTEVEAFAVLRTASRNSNRKLRDLAAELVSSAGLIDPSG
jgi:hypothetical protein